MGEFPMNKKQRFCSPDYCRCSFWAKGDFPSSRIHGCGDVLLLEATAEGIHIYDFVHRMFEMPHYASRHNAIALRRLSNAPSRRDQSRIAEFVQAVRGSLYMMDTRVKNYEDLDRHCYRCAPLVSEFYKYMGWASFGDGVDSMMPSGFAGDHNVNVNQAKL